MKIDMDTVRAASSPVKTVDNILDELTSAIYAFSATGTDRKALAMKAIDLVGEVMYSMTNSPETEDDAKQMSDLYKEMRVQILEKMEKEIVPVLDIFRATREVTL